MMSSGVLEGQPPSCTSSPTCQGVLALRQIEDLMKSSSFGAVVSSSILVPAQTWRSCSAEVAPTPHTLNLIGWIGGAIQSATGEAPAEPSVNSNSPPQVCPHGILIRENYINLYLNYSRFTKWLT